MIGEVLLKTEKNKELLIRTEIIRPSGYEQDDTFSQDEDDDGTEIVYLLWNWEGKDEKISLRNTVISVPNNWVIFLIAIEI